jgi:hypothetical protein
VPQYLVTSLPLLCNDPLGQPVEVVPMPFQPAHAMLQTTHRWLGLPPMTVPLLLAMEYVARHRAELEKQIPLKPALQQWLQSLSEASK